MCTKINLTLKNYSFEIKNWLSFMFLVNIIWVIVWWLSKYFFLCLLIYKTVSSVYHVFKFFFLVGNKNDAPDRKVVLTEDAQRFADQMGIQLYETSAKDNINVEQVLF